MILFLLLGIVFMALGIYSMTHSRKMRKLGMSQAYVQDCQPSTLEVLSKSIPCNEITLEIHTAYGVVYKTVKDNLNYQIGQAVDVFYDAQTDKLELAKNVAPADPKGPLLVIGFGAMIVLLIISSEMMKHSDAFAEGFGTVVSYVLAVIFIVAGAYTSMVQPMKRKKAMGDCHKVQGTQVDFIKKRGHNKGWIYTPIFGYYHNGQELQLQGTVSGNGSKYHNIGRKVTIVINDVTGEAYCEDDMNASKKLGVIFLLIGIVLGAVLIGRDFFGMF